MKADEIREWIEAVNKVAELAQNSPAAANFGMIAISAKAQIEIAAQLAEINHSLTAVTHSYGSDGRDWSLNFANIKTS